MASTTEGLFETALSAAHDAEVKTQEAADSYAVRKGAVVALREHGVSLGVIAKRLGLTRSGVQAILRP